MATAGVKNLKLKTTDTNSLVLIADVF